MGMTGNFSIGQNDALFMVHLFLDCSLRKFVSANEKDIALSVLHSHCRAPRP
jgi:hypothetical protein